VEEAKFGSEQLSDWSALLKHVKRCCICRRWVFDRNGGVGDDLVMLGDWEIQNN
jgi:hypothetical protein